MTVPNPPIAGHHLLNEGAVFSRFKPWTGSVYSDNQPEWNGGCQCGAKPFEFPHVSKSAMQRWHREHKTELRRALGFPGVPTEVELLRQLVTDFNIWAEHPSTCQIEQAGPDCDCGLDALRQRVKELHRG